MKRYLTFALLVDITMSFVLGIVFFRNDSFFFVKGFGLVAMSDIILSVVIRIIYSLKMKKYMKEHPEEFENNYDEDYDDEDYDDDQNESSHDLSMFR